MIHLLVAVLLAAAPASRASDDLPETQDLAGLYAAIGGGGAILFVPGDDDIGYDFEVRLGYSFGRNLQLYLAGSVDGASFSGAAFRAEQIVGCAQYNFLVRSAWMLYGRIGLGVALSGDLAPDTVATGFAEAVGLGAGIRIAPNLFVAPEVFFRNTKLSANQTDRRVQVVGLQLNLAYY
jgi:hypothetical protein